MAQTQRGIDYGLGKTNIDTATGIRYGVISQHSLAGWFYDEYEADYGAARCPQCGDSEVMAPEVTDDGDGAWFKGLDGYTHDGGCVDYVCHHCRITFDSLAAYPDEPIGYELKSDEYHAIDCLDSDVMVLKSPYYTYAAFCSPCVPGAGNLDSADGESNSGVKTYCFSHEYFEDGKAPYRVFRVADDSEVLAEEN